MAVILSGTKWQSDHLDFKGDRHGSGHGFL